MGYLDDLGLSHFWQKNKALLTSAQTAAQEAKTAADAAQRTANAAATPAQVNSAIQAAVLDSWEGTY